MNYLNSLLKPGNRQHLFVIVLLTLYIVLDVKSPKFVAVLVDSLAGNLAIAGFVIAMLCKGTNSHSRVICALGMVAAFQLIKRSSVATGSHGLRTMLPSEEKRGREFSAMNEIQETLEEETVNNMQPMTTHSPEGSASYSPVLQGLTGATSL